MSYDCTRNGKEENEKLCTKNNLLDVSQHKPKRIPWNVGDESKLRFLSQWSRRNVMCSSATAISVSWFLVQDLWITVLQKPWSFILCFVRSHFRCKSGQNHIFSIFIGNIYDVSFSILNPLLSFFSSFFSSPFIS